MSLARMLQQKGRKPHRSSETAGRRVDSDHPRPLHQQQGRRTDSYPQRIHDPRRGRPAASGNQPAPAVCDRATRAIVVEGPGKRGEVVQVCADPECEVHGKPNYKAEQEELTRRRESEWKRKQEQQQKIVEKNRRLFEAVLAKAPKTLSQADFEMLAIAAIDRLEFEYLDGVCERYGVNTGEARDEDAAQAELRARAQKATESELIRMLIELALLPSGYSYEELSPIDPLAQAAERYAVHLQDRKQPKQKRAAMTKTGGAKPTGKVAPSGKKREKRGAKSGRVG